MSWLGVTWDRLGQTWAITAQPLTLAELLLLLAFALFSLADLRYRTVPGIEIFFLGAIFIAAPGRPWNVIAIILATAWGWIRSWPTFLALPFLLYPPSWVVLLTGYGVRQGVIGRADLLAAGALACLFPWPAVVLSFASLELWRRWWVRHRTGSVPALPGMMLGVLVYCADWLALSA